MGEIMEPLFGTATNNPCSLSKHWIDACSIWVETIKKICINFDYSDAPWEYLERTNSSIFASALTASGVPSMPEAYIMRDGRKEQKDQRVDVCSVDKGQSIELIEFKMAEYDALYPQTEKRIESKIKEATKQVNRITGIHGKEISTYNLKITRSVAVLGLPCFEPGTPKLEMENAIQIMIKDIQKSTYDVKAWVFHSEYIVNPSCRYRGRDGRKKFYVGTFVVAKHA